MTTSAAPTPDESPRGLGLAGLIEIVRRRRALAVLPFLFVLTAAASLAFFLPGLWTARAVILVDRQQIPETYVKSTIVSDLDSRLLTLSQEILSRDRLLAISERFNLYPTERANLTPDELVDEMRRDIRVETLVDDRDRRSRDERSVAFAVGYTAADPHVATAVANTLASLYIAENTKLREQQAAGTTRFLEAQLTEVRARLQGQEKRIGDYKEQHLGELPEQKEATLRTLDRLQQQLQLAHESHRRANERRQLLTHT
ncbi:MAG: Wzz/FepE/Etk N-terminal domain-containing protein, partial [Candidatus Rokuibacteriota bacterium]